MYKSNKPKNKFSNSKSTTSTKYFTNMASSIGIPSSSVINRSLPSRPATAGNSRSGLLELDFMRMINANGYDKKPLPDGIQYDHPPLPAEPSGLYDTLITEADMAFMKKKFVKVTSSSEVEMEPDIVEFCIKITTNKADTAKGKESVKKRKDFVLAALRKFGVAEHNISISAIVKRVSLPIVGPDPDDIFLQDAQRIAFGLKRDRIKGKGNGEQHQLEFRSSDVSDIQNKDDLEKPLAYLEELCIKCNSLGQYLKVFSICNEKLDRYVELSRPVVRFSAICLQSSTEKAVRQAMTQATSKANDLISSSKPRVSLGRLYYSVEESLEVEDIKGFEPTTASFETFGWKRYNKMVRCRLTSVFELDHPKMRR